MPKTEKFIDLGEYVRVQDDNQIVTERSPNQQRIFEEYFVVKKYKRYNLKLQWAFIICFIVAIIALAVSIALKFSLIPLILAGILLIAGITLLIVYKKTAKKVPKKIITDAEYEQLVADKITEMDIANSGVIKLNLGEFAIDETNPIILKSKVVKDSSLTVFNAEDDGRLHSSTQNVMAIYFAENQLYFYKTQFDMCCNEKIECLREFFYQDVCDIRSCKKTNVLVFGLAKVEYACLELEIISTNSSVSFTMDGTEENEEIVKNLRQIIREKRKVS